MFKRLQFYLKDVIFGRKKGIIPFCIKIILLGLSWCYRLIVAVRNWLYDQGWMRRYVPPVPLVLSVGNIVAGGTGKTPVTLLFAKTFYERFPMAILSRGYRSKIEKLDHPVILCEGSGPIYPAAYCGDEPYIFAQRLPKAHVIVGGDRQKASCLAAKAGVQVILLDDGMQHRRIARDLEVVVVDVYDPFGQGYFLPRGFLREDAKSLARAHLVILNHVKSPEQFQSLKSKLLSYTSAPMVGTHWKIGAIRDLKGQEVGSIKDKRVGMFCGIAHPEYFRHTLIQEGASIVSEYCLVDHDEPEEKELNKFAHACSKKEAHFLICTEKDRVKLKDSLSLALPIVWLQMELEVVEAKDVWADFLIKAESKIF
jgi:tetraacyldisaccharide 4'-kinase